MELCLKPWQIRSAFPARTIAALQAFKYVGLTVCYDVIMTMLKPMSAAMSAVGATTADMTVDVGMKAGELFDLYGNSILRLAYSYLHNREDAEDILQNTLIRYIETAPLFFSKAHEKAWLLTVAANLSKNLIKHNKVRDADELLEELVAEEKEDLAYVWEAAKKLPDNQREAVHLFYQEGYSTKEIAGILERKEATVRSDLKRGRERLKEILENEYGVRY